MSIDDLRMTFTYDEKGSPATIDYNGTRYFYVTNIQGDVVAILNSSGTKVVEYTYDAWGNPLSITGSMASTLGEHNPLRYRGYVYDTETGLYYLQSRYYNPEMGRFICADEAASTGNGLLGSNMFAYCGNNPVNRTDMSGKDWWHWAAAAAIVAVAAVAVVATAGGAAGAILAISAVANGVAVSSTATTIAAGVFVGSSVALASTAYSAMIESDTAEEFAQHGEEGLIATAVGGVAGGISANSLPGHNCFIAGTLVYTPDGNVPIERIKQGDLVWAWDEETGEVSQKAVVETYVNETDELVHVFVNGEEIITTPSHPFYSPVKGWTDAIHLRAGDILVLVNGEYVVIEWIQHEILESPVTVYNFQVADYHTYYVTDNGVLVHNACTNSNGKKGCEAHQNTIAEIGNDLESRGYKVTYEYKVDTFGGYKNTRYVDVYATKGTDSVGIQVGRMTSSGIPVARERKALADLLENGINAVFVAYRK